LRRPKLSTRKFSDWKKKKRRRLTDRGSYSAGRNTCPTPYMDWART
jgi:hypothetical protein